ncbi:MAG: M20/M25/M40 family metallo-hydrolase [Clostridium sp.]
MINKERVLKRFLDYVQIDSESKQEKAFAERLVNDLRSIGLEVYQDSAHESIGGSTGNVIGRLKGNNDSEALLFSCHMDTVTPGKGIKPIVENGVIKTDGTTILGGDDKAGIVAIIEALTSIVEEKISHPTIEVAFSIAEEIGLYGAKALDCSKLDAKRAFVLDSGGEIGGIVIKGPAQDKITVEIKGKPAHAGVCPEDGISAIQIASKAIDSMNLLRIDENTTANIGKITGGIATNVVCPSVVIDAEARSTVIESLDKQTAHMVSEFEKAAKQFGGEVTIDVVRLYGQFVVEENDEIVELAKKASKELGLEPYTTSTGGGSDTNILNGKGIKAVNLAIGERKPHTLEESYHVEDLVKVSTLVKELIKNA